MRSKQLIDGKWVEAPVMQPPVPVDPVPESKAVAKPPEDFDALVEFRARTLYKSDHPYAIGDMAWGRRSRHIQGPYLLRARASIIAEWNAGVACVPRDGSVEMFEALEAHTNVCTAFRVAVGRTPYKPEDGK